MKIAVTVNEMSKVNVDAELVKQDGGLSRTDEKLGGRRTAFSPGGVAPRRGQARCCVLREKAQRHVSSSRRKSPLPIGHKAKYSNSRAYRPD
jgi:G3E family GTPase